MLIGRKREQEELRQAFRSDSSQFVAVYGRRRVGKTFLVRETFGYNFTFQHSGVSGENTHEQLKYFRNSLMRCGLPRHSIPKDWSEAFTLLEKLILLSSEEKKVVFLDEVPWMDTPRSGFVTALEYFWNVFASSRKDILLVVCGSATSWIINNVLKNHGGLHNRVSRRILLQPFTLCECEAFAQSMGMGVSRYDILEYYMVLGGVAFYWSLLDKGKSVAQNIDSLIFSSSGQLHNEFNELYDSLFANSVPYIKVINALGASRIGMTRGEISKAVGISPGMQMTRILGDLETCGFIKKQCTFGKMKNDAFFSVIDNFTLFCFKFLHSSSSVDENFWSHSSLSPARNAWTGLAFERICLSHVQKIKEALGVSGVLTTVYSWQVKEDPIYGAGAQVDLIIDRADNVINLCEMKFSREGFVIDKDCAASLIHKVERFKQSSKTRKSIHLTMVTSHGIARNMYWNIVQSEVTADDLF